MPPLSRCELSPVRCLQWPMGNVGLTGSHRRLALAIIAAVAGGRRSVDRRLFGRLGNGLLLAALRYLAGGTPLRCIRPAVCACLSSPSA